MPYAGRFAAVPLRVVGRDQVYVAEAHDRRASAGLNTRCFRYLRAQGTGGAFGGIALRTPPAWPPRITLGSRVGGVRPSVEVGAWTTVGWCSVRWDGESEPQPPRP